MQRHSPLASIWDQSFQVGWASVAGDGLAISLCPVLPSSLPWAYFPRDSPGNGCSVSREPSLSRVLCMRAQSYLILCDPMDCSPPGSSVRGISQQESWGGFPFPPPGDLPDPGIKPHLQRPLNLQVGSLPQAPPSTNWKIPV